MLSETVAVTPRWRWRDVVMLAKPRLSLLVFLTTAAGCYLAPGHVSWPRLLLILVASALVVGAANTINSYLECDSDARMRRTRNRPIPAGRIEPRWALALGTATAIIAMWLLYLAANPLTALLSFFAFASYAWVYTPMKRYTWLAVVVGAVPGAIPPLMGYTAVTNHLSAPGWSLFALLFFWQLPHFFAIALYLKDDYARGGFKVLPLEIGERGTVWCIIGSTCLLIPISLLPVWLGFVAPWYAVAALVLGVAFLAWTLIGLRGQHIGRWARGVFVGSIAYLTLLLVVLLLGAR